MRFASPSQRDTVGPDSLDATRGDDIVIEEVRPSAPHANGRSWVSRNVGDCLGVVGRHNLTIKVEAVRIFVRMIQETAAAINRTVVQSMLLLDAVIVRVEAEAPIHGVSARRIYVLLGLKRVHVH